MKSFWCILVMVSVLFMSVEGAADSVIEGHAHGDGASHSSDTLEPADLDPASDPEPDAEHCEQCCHGHTVSVMATGAPSATSFIVSDHAAGARAPAHSFVQAPPTPPPNV